MHDFTPWSALAGGVAIGLATSLLLLATGRIAGISGIVGGILNRTPGDVSWRVAFVAGLVVAGIVAAWWVPNTVSASPRAALFVAIAGLLVGIGTRLGNGCTSGHGVCGLSRFSIRSLVATLTFIVTGVVAATLGRILGGGA